MENKYKRLVSNTALFAISTFSSKLLFFVMAPLFSYWFDTQQMAGIKELLNQFANFCIPVVSLGISNAVIRFGLDKNIDKRQVYTNGFVAVGMGFAVLLAVSPLLARISWYTDYIALLCVYVLVSCLRTLNCQFVRARQLNRLYAIDGILCTIVTCLFYVLFLRFLNLGPTGYLLAVICGDGFSTLFLFCTARLWKFIRFGGKKGLLRQMLRYSLPLVPASIFWWVTNASDQMFVAAMMKDGEAVAAVYGSSYKLPTILTVVASIFTEAWQISAFTDGTEAQREKFFSRVFDAYQGLMFVAGAGLILMAQPFMLLFRKDYFYGWHFIPLLVIATIFSSLSNFLNSIYMVEKRSGLSLYTMAVGAGLNCVLNFLLIPKMGVNGAVVATLISYVVVFLLRVYNTRSLVRIQFAPLKLCVNTAVLLLESLLMLYEIPLWPLWCVLLCFLALFVNLQEIGSTVMHLLHTRRGKN
ncbi:MAG: polysaccharide biosynthesis C-terminal domain-containing protein [Ruthenibacterium sp.]